MPKTLANSVEPQLSRSRLREGVAARLVHDRGQEENFTNLKDYPMPQARNDRPGFVI
jgi:hypothetical protein